MTEIEYKGIRVSGGKLLLILPLLGTLGGALWGGFEFFKDYTDMKAQIQSYVAPDLSGFDKELAVLKEEMSSLTVEVESTYEIISSARDYTKEVKNDLKNELHQMSLQLDNTEKRTKQTEDSVRDSLDTSENAVRDSINETEAKAREDRIALEERFDTRIETAESRFDARREQIRNDMIDLEERINTQMKTLQTETDDKIRKALETPLSKLQ